MQIHEMAKVEIRLLETQIGAEQETRPVHPEATAQGRMASARTLGVPIENAWRSCEPNTRIFGR